MRNDDISFRDSIRHLKLIFSFKIICYIDLNQILIQTCAMIAGFLIFPWGQKTGIIQEIPVSSLLVFNPNNRRPKHALSSLGVAAECVFVFCMQKPRFICTQDMSSLSSCMLDHACRAAYWHLRAHAGLEIRAQLLKRPEKVRRRQEWFQASQGLQKFQNCCAIQN